MTLSTLRGGAESGSYAVALAERLDARLYVLQLTGLTGRSSIRKTDDSRIEGSIAAIIAEGKRAGIVVSRHITKGPLKNDIINLVRDEHINLLVYHAEDELCAQLLKQIGPKRLPLQIVQVKKKEHVEYPHSGKA